MTAIELINQLEALGFVEYEHFRISPQMCYHKMESLDSSKIVFMFEENTYSFKFSHYDGKFYYRSERYRYKPIPDMPIATMIVLYK